MAASAASPTIPRDGNVLGFDVGSRRIGVALGSGLTGARALAVVEVRADGPDWAALARLQAEWRPVGLVVGDPLTLEGGDQPNRKRARAFARQLHERWRLPVVMVARPALPPAETATDSSGALRWVLARHEALRGA